jgi:serine/threonine protein kinase/alpha-beta hydrolase superfamily lysophospholipase
MPLSSGTRLGPYEILTLLGSGGMGEVYRARDTRLPRDVALKILPAEMSDEPSGRQNLAQEARAVASLNDPHICTLHDIGVMPSGAVYLVMEYIEGNTLRSLMERAPLGFDQLLVIGGQIADALAVAHGAGIVHGDIKPGNIMLTPRGDVKILDFGLARNMQPPTRTASTTATLESVTEPRKIAGTLAYMSPEQIRGEAIDGRSDLFSLGVLLYEGATGRPPFDGPTFVAIATAIATIDPPLPSSLRPDLPPAFDRVIALALAKDRERHRYISASVLAEDLRSLLAASRSPARVPAPHPQTRYAKSEGLNIAYQVVGDGPVDLVYIMGWVTNLDHFWEEPSYARFLNRLARSTRLILFDKRGTGLSDRVPDAQLPTLEQRMDDVRAVMDAVRSERAIAFGVSEGGPMAALFSATYPHRTLGLVMYGSYAKRIWDEEYPWAPTPEEREKFFHAIRNDWGGIVDLATLAPSAIHDAAFREWWASYLRQSASPGAALTLAKMNTQVDIRHVLPTIGVPTLILHRTGDLDIDVGGSRYMARRIPVAKFVELPGEDHLPWVGDQDAILKEVDDFVQRIDQVTRIDRVLATVLYAELGYCPSNAADAYRAVLVDEIRRFRGQEIEIAPRRTLAIFDGPARAIRAACAIRDGARTLGLQPALGLHTGECEISAGRAEGETVEVTRHIVGRARSGEVLISHTVKDLVPGSGFRFEDRGTHSFPGLDGEWYLLLVAS